MIQKKICMLGAYGVGKTSLVRRYVESIFDEKYLITVGVRIEKKRVDLDDLHVELLLWDIAGVEDRYSVPSHYVRGASGYILVIDGTRAQTVEVALDLIDQIGEDVGKLPFVIALNKSDLVEQWEISEPMLEPFERLQGPVLRSSARTGEGVEEAFVALTRLLV